jgi:hypothetical protein
MSKLARNGSCEGYPGVLNTLRGELTSNVLTGKRAHGSSTVPGLDPTLKLVGQIGADFPSVVEELAPVRHARNVRTPRLATAVDVCSGGKSEAYEDVVYNHEPPAT